MQDDDNDISGDISSFVTFAIAAFVLTAVLLSGGSPWGAVALFCLGMFRDGIYIWRKVRIETPTTIKIDWALAIGMLSLGIVMSLYLYWRQ